ALHRAPRAAEDRRHLLLGKIMVVAQDDGAPLGLGERGEEAAGVDGGVDRPGGAGAGVRGGGFDRLERRPAAPVAAEVDGDLEEPGREATPRVEAARRAPPPQPRPLVEVLDITPPGVPGDELVERALVAP